MSRPVAQAARPLLVSAVRIGRRCPHLSQQLSRLPHRLLSCSSRPLLFPHPAPSTPSTSPSTSPLRVQPAPTFSPSSFSTTPTPPIPSREWDVVIVGGGHNGLVAAAYLAGRGLSVAVLERRHVLGGAAVTEEVYPGYKYSRASYLFSLFRPQIVKGHLQGSTAAAAVARHLTRALTSDGWMVCGCVGSRAGAETPRAEVLLP